jgi:aldose 1-epimerase
MITVEKTVLGQIKGAEIDLFTLTNRNEMTVKITNFGGIVTSILVPDLKGRTEDVVLGFDSIEGYLGVHPYFGCIVGRYANRIAKGTFQLDGKTYNLARNNGDNHLHGGVSGFDKKIWKPAGFKIHDEAGIELSYKSIDGEEGYPGTLNVKVIFSLNNDNELKIQYFAETDHATPLNLTHHGYFNLKGAGNGNIQDHFLAISASRYTVVDELLIPTGELREVTGTLFDFRQGKQVGRDIDKVKGGYDHNFVLDATGGLIKAATVSEPLSGRWMEVYTDQPGMQFYSSNLLDGSITGKNGKAYQKRYGLCLETQNFPDSPNQPDFPDAILRPGDSYHSVTIYKFGTAK